jgi:hypothetical protein
MEHFAKNLIEHTFSLGAAAEYTRILRIYAFQILNGYWFPGWQLQHVRTETTESHKLAGSWIGLPQEVELVKAR